MLAWTRGWDVCVVVVRDIGDDPGAADQPGQTPTVTVWGLVGDPLVVVLTDPVLEILTPRLRVGRERLPLDDGEGHHLDVGPVDSDGGGDRLDETPLDLQEVQDRHHGPPHGLAIGVGDVRPWPPGRSLRRPPYGGSRRLVGVVLLLAELLAEPLDQRITPAVDGAHRTPHSGHGCITVS